MSANLPLSGDNSNGPLIVHFWLESSVADGFSLIPRRDKASIAALMRKNIEMNMYLVYFFIVQLLKTFVVFAIGHAAVILFSVYLAFTFVYRLIINI